MNSYEIMTITELSLGEEGARTLSNSIKDLVNSFKGKVNDSNFWGKRKYAYEIKHIKEGFYDVIKFEMSPTEVPALKAKLSLVKGLVRYLVTSI